MPSKPSSVLNSLRARPCIADMSGARRHAHKPILSCGDAPWELHAGFSRLAIIGHEADCWFYISEPCYLGQVGSDEERRIGEQAVKILCREHRHDQALSPEQFAAIMRRAGGDYQTTTPTPTEAS